MDIHKLLSQAVDKTVTCSRTGGGVGSIWVIEFENDPYFMIYCSWRVESNEKVITTSNDDGTPHVGHMIVNTKKLIGNKLMSYTLSKQNDLILNFDNNFVVKVFCHMGFETEKTQEDYKYENWAFCIPSLDIAVTITTDFRQVYTKYTSGDKIE